MLSFECPICLDNIKYASIGSCTHHFCYFCLFKHCKNSNECPMCKTKIFEIKIDREFDMLINNDSLPNIVHRNVIIINPDLNVSDPGLTITNNLKGPGVVITQLKTSGYFKHFNFKINDIILFINEVPCISHILVMEQIMNLYSCGKEIKCILLK
jgi:hypothetical protein